MANSERDNLSYDESDPFTRWGIEKAEKEENSEPKLS
jgi:hypothetical protein